MMGKYTKDSAREADKDKLSVLASVREVTDNFGGIAKMWDECFELQRKIYR